MLSDPRFTIAQGRIIVNTRYAQQNPIKYYWWWLVGRHIKLNVGNLALRLSGIKYVEIKHDTPITIDQEKEVVEILKRNQFVETDRGWICGFVRIVITKTGTHIGHDIKGNKLTVVSNPLLSLSDHIKYFKRL